MAEYHSTLKKLEDMVQTRVRLIAKDSSHSGVDKHINARLSTLRAENSMPSRAEEYCRRLKIVKQQLGGYAMGDMDALIAKQEGLEGNAKPNMGRPRSPKIAPPPVVTLPKQPKPAVAANVVPPFAWGIPAPAPANSGVWPSTAIPAASPQHVPAPPVPGAWPASNLQQATLAAVPAGGQATVQEPPALHISILRMRGTDKGKHFKYRNKRSHAPCAIKMGGAHYLEDYSGFTHPLLAKPNKIGTVQWSPNSTLMILNSHDYIPHARGNTVHIQAYSKEDVLSLINHLRVWYGNGITQVFEISRYIDNQNSRL
ncbi:MAG: hypothetical protein Q9208_004150 [Pyrenodesmia sp. 3 TL-2023]